MWQKGLRTQTSSLPAQWVFPSSNSSISHLPEMKTDRQLPPTHSTCSVSTLTRVCEQYNLSLAFSLRFFLPSFTHCVSSVLIIILPYIQGERKYKVSTQGAYHNLIRKAIRIAQNTVGIQGDKTFLHLGIMEALMEI